MQRLAAADGLDLAPFGFRIDAEQIDRDGLVGLVLVHADDHLVAAVDRLLRGVGGVIANAWFSHVHAWYRLITCWHSAAFTVKKCDSGPFGGMP